VVEELKRRIEDLSQQVEAADSESFSRMTTIRQKDKEIATLQKDVTKLRRDKDDMVEQLERLKKPAGKSDVDTLRAEIVDRMAEINNLEKEVDSLKKELASKESAREREVRNDSSSNEVAALKSRCTSLQQDNERLSKLLREKEREKESSTANGKGYSDDGRKGGGTTNVVLSRDGREDDLRKQLTTLRQELDEKILLEKSIYCVEPQFRAGLSISATLILDVLPDAKGNKDKDKDKILSHTLTLIVSGLETAVKRSHLDSPMLCYWLSTCISILVKLRKKQDNEIYDSSSLVPSASSASPITRFEYSVTTLASKIYAQLVKNVVTRLEEELVALLLHSHHMPRGTPLASGAGLVLAIINQIHSNLVDYHVPPPIAAQLFTQIYYYINAVLFNCMLTPGPSREDLCTCTSGFRIRLQLSRLEEWIPTPAQSSLLVQGQLMQLRDQLAPAVQASKLLVIDKKLLKDYEVFEQLCPVLSVAHVRRILSNYMPDALSPEPLPGTITQTLDVLEKKERDKGGNSQGIELDPTVVRNLSLSFLSAEK
jgi:myosin heavy subunit